MQRRRDRKRNDGAEPPRDDERQGGADSRPDGGGKQRDQQDLDAVDREHVAAAGAERLHGADGVALARQMRRDRIRHADAADQQRGQGDQGEELGEAFDAALELSATPCRACGSPSRRRGRPTARLCRSPPRRASLARRGQAQPVLPAHQAAGLDEAGGAQRRLADEDARPEADAGREPVGLFGQRGAQIDRGAADGDAVADFQIEPGEQRRIDGGAERAVFFRQQRRQRHVGIARHLAEQRIGGIDRFDFDQGHLAAAGARHGAHGGGLGHGAVCIQEGALGIARLALNEREGEVAAEDDLAGAGDAVGEARGHRADARDGHHAKRDAGDENPEAAQAAAQFAPGKTQRREAACSRHRRVHQRAFGMKRASRKCTGA